MEESYILVLLTILILLVVVIGYFGQKKIREIELSTNALKCDFETHTEHVNNILLQQNNTIGGVMNGGGMTCNELNQSVLESNNDLDLSKLQNIMTNDYTVLNERNDEIYRNLNDNLKCIDDSDDESLVIENNTELLGNNSEDSDNDNFSSDSDEETLPIYNVISEEESSTVENNVEEDVEDNYSENNIANEVSETKNVVEDNDSEPLQLTVDHSSKKKERKVPNQVASRYESGHESLSENDGKLYKVTEYKSGKKRWVLAK
jgi:hypothetical protein